jgi:hypothetical protein
MGEFLYRKVGKSPIFAPEFTYALNRMREGTFSQGDVGANVRTSVEVPDPKVGPGCVGWCPVEVPGYTPYDITTPPSAAQLAAAKPWPGGAFHAIGNNIVNMKSCMVSGYTFVIGIGVYDSFEEDSVAASGIIPFPNLNTESLQGGHEELAGLGYDDTIQCPNSPNPGAVLLQNSWSEQWGAKHPATGVRGYEWLSYDYLMSPSLTSDVWMDHLGKAW